MQNRSTTITGSIVMLVATLLVVVGIPIGEGQLAEVVDTVAKLAGLITNIITPIIIWKDRKSKGDVELFGKRIKKTETPPQPTPIDTHD